MLACMVNHDKLAARFERKLDLQEWLKMDSIFGVAALTVYDAV